MGRKLTRKGFKRQLDVLWGQVILARDGYVCQRSGKRLDSDQLDPHHIWGKSSLALRYSLSGGITLSKKYHRFEPDAVHGVVAHSFDWKGLFIKFLGSEERYWEIRRLKDKQKMYPTMESLKDLEQSLEKMLKLYEGG